MSAPGGSALASSLSGVGGALGGVAAIGNMISDLLPTTTKTTFSGQNNKATSQVMLDDDAINRMLNIIMQASDGLQSVAGGERTAGIFNSTTNQQLVNDLMVRAAGQVAVAAAPTVQTQEMGPTVTKQKSSKCFITTAVCGYLGKPDDCAELTTLRAFRDSWMVSNGHTDDLAIYYEYAPKMVDAINSVPQVADLVWGYIYHKYISPAVQAILVEDHGKAYNIYREMFNYISSVIIKLAAV